MTIFWIWGLACQAPIFGTADLRWMVDPQKNTTRLMMWKSLNYKYALSWVLIYNSGVQPIAAQVIVMVATKMMISKLRESSEFRTSAGTATEEMSSKERKLISMVVAVASIFIVCNTPHCVVTVLRMIMPDIDVGRRYHNLSNVLYRGKYTAMAINAAVNTFVYYNCSSRYKAILKGFFNKNV